MEIKLVYRILRKISDWTVDGYYSETFVEGQHNVPPNGPLIIASTHHNEMIDIATLASTMPHRRHLSFWAKSTMFVNPISGAILSSSGAIPVRRNPNNNNSSPPPNGSEENLNASSSLGSASASGSGSPTPSNRTSTAELSLRSILFRDTSKALAKDQVVGVFPEGTSYTQSSIVQIMPGAAWAAVEFARYVNKGEGKSEWDRKSMGLVGEKGKGKGKGKEKEKEVRTGLRIVPVAIVYTDKSKYQSRISVSYGEPIFMDDYMAELFEGDPDEASKAVVKKLMGQVERQLKEMTINAPDWDTICAVSMARSILWEDDRKIPLEAWVQISQRLVQMLSTSPENSSSDNEAVIQLKKALTKYYALLHYSGIKHSILLPLLPLSSSSVLDIPPPHALPDRAVLGRPTLSILAGLPLSLVQLVLFMPPLLLHFPGYITGSLARRLSVPGEEESPAQFKAIGAGFGVGSNIALALGVLWKKNKLATLSTLLGLGKWEDGGRLASVKRILGVIATVYCSVLVLVKWHKLLVNANYRNLQRLLTYHKIVSAFAFSHRRGDILSPAALEAYTKPPLPAVNLYIKKKTASASSSSSSLPYDTGVTNNMNTSDSPTRSRTPPPPPPPIASRKLIRHLLLARSAACAALSVHLKTMEDKTLVRYLTSRGANVPV